ncbi:hypothetical protein IRT45_32880 [Nocardia sp. BSTN01]|uniref:ADP-ribosyltransferase n=1 Tax=Nocardia sp. BSTN01 TaxID=2783665 RepID=UPI00188FD4D9|nr:ADP-ribosyltransferase [Nocardia sp. BSTN01]MBF5001917.1 hypothetical protein [Nocardia sp. BSTN01]
MRISRAIADLFRVRIISTILRAGEAAKQDAGVIREIGGGEAKTTAWEVETADLAGKRQILASEADSAGSPGSRGMAHPSDSGRPQPGTDIVHGRPTSAVTPPELNHRDVDAIADHTKGGNGSINWALAHEMEKGVKIEQDLAKSSKELQTLPDLGEDPQKPPKMDELPKPRAARVAPAGWTRKDSDALLDYTLSGGRELNSALRSGRVDGNALSVENINEALRKLPDYKGVVSRRVRSSEMPPEVLARYRKGARVTESGFTSTSRAANGTLFPGDVEFQILSKTGKDITEYSQPTFRAEQEVLFPPKATFDVEDRFIDPATGRTIIRMVER